MPDDNFDIDFKALPPELQVRLWILALDADTSKVNLKYESGGFSKLTLGLTYNYGGALEASLKTTGQSYQLGYDPGASSLTAGGVYRGFRFNLSTSLAQPKVGASIGWGRALLPFPSELETTFMNANTGFFGVMDTIRANPDNPLKWYSLTSDDRETIQKGIKTGQAIYKAQQSKVEWGAGLRMNYAPDSGLLIMLGAGGRF
jgi:hypothetical protein